MSYFIMGSKEEVSFERSYVTNMDYMTISEVSSTFQVSTRMLRYYEKAGLITSTRREGYAYRIYDADAVRSIQQILILRKLQIPLKQINRMMRGSKEEAIRILETHIREMNDHEAAFRRMKHALETLLKLLREGPSGQNYMELVQEDMIVEVTKLLPLTKHQLKEDTNMSAAENNAKEMVEKGSCVRIVQLPPFTAASYQFTGENPEEAAGGVISSFIRSSGLYEKKPDARMFGFNHPDPEPGSDLHGYEIWVTIPDDNAAPACLVDVPAPLTKKHFPGGLYAAYTIQFPEFWEWQFLTEWVNKSETWQADFHDPALKDMGGCLEEHLNWVYSAHMGFPENGRIDGKLDLMLPIRPR